MTSQCLSTTQTQDEPTPLSIAEMRMGPPPVEQDQKKASPPLGSIPEAAGDDDEARAEYFALWGIGFGD